MLANLDLPRIGAALGCFVGGIVVGFAVYKLISVRIRRNESLTRWGGADVTVSAAETMGWLVLWFTETGDADAATPPLLQVPLAIGPHREKARVPLQLEVPVTVRLAESLTCTEPVPIDRPEAGTVVVPSLSTGVVTTVAPQEPNRPSARS